LGCLFNRVGHALTSSVSLSYMHAAPVWLSYASPAVAAVALCVSFATFRRAGPRIKGKLTVPNLPKPTTTSRSAYLAQLLNEDVVLTIRLFNSGLAGVEIIGFFAAFGLQGIQFTTFEFTDDDVYTGEKLPYRMDGGSSKTWALSLVEPLSRLNTTDLKLNKVRFRFFRSLVGGLWAVTPNAGVVVALGNATEIHVGVGTWKLIKSFLTVVRLTAP
jgi:hypothetical protein